MKIISILIGLVLAFASLASVEAYGIYGNQGNSYYGGYPFGYQESTDFYKNFNLNSNFNAFSGQDSGLFENSGRQFSDLFDSRLSSGTNGYSNSYAQNFLNDANTNLNDGYSFTKGPCVVEVVKGDFRGKDNDFTLSKKVCDNIEGTFYKDNNYVNSLSNAASVDNNDFGANAYQNQYTNQNTLNNNYNNQQSYSNSQDSQHQDLSVSFGKGTRIVLN